MTTATPPETRPKLNSAIARAIVKAVVATERAQRALDTAKAKKSALEKYAHLVPYKIGAEGAGHIIKTWIGGGGEIFKLKEYREAGHPITPEMKPFIEARSTFRQWTVTPIEGPPEP